MARSLYLRFLGFVFSIFLFRDCELEMGETAVCAGLDSKEKGDEEKGEGEGHVSFSKF